MGLKRIMGVISTALLTGTMIFGVSHTSAYADIPSRPYQVVTLGEGNYTIIYEHSNAQGSALAWELPELNGL